LAIFFNLRLDYKELTSIFLVHTLGYFPPFKAVFSFTFPPQYYVFFLPFILILRSFPLTALAFTSLMILVFVSAASHRLFCVFDRTLVTIFFAHLFAVFHVRNMAFFRAFLFTSTRFRAHAIFGVVPILGEGDGFLPPIFFFFSS